MSVIETKIVQHFNVVLKPTETHPTFINKYVESLKQCKLDNGIQIIPYYNNYKDDRDTISYMIYDCDEIKTLARITTQKAPDHETIEFKRIFDENVVLRMHHKNSTTSISKLLSDKCELLLTGIHLSFSTSYIYNDTYLMVKYNDKIEFYDADYVKVLELNYQLLSVCPTHPRILVLRKPQVGDFYYDFDKKQLIEQASGLFVEWNKTYAIEQTTTNETNMRQFMIPECKNIVAKKLNAKDIITKHRQINNMIKKLNYAEPTKYVAKMEQLLKDKCELENELYKLYQI